MKYSKTFKQIKKRMTLEDIIKLRMEQIINKDLGFPITKLTLELNIIKEGF